MLDRNWTELSELAHSDSVAASLKRLTVAVRIALILGCYPIATFAAKDGGCLFLWFPWCGIGSVQRRVITGSGAHSYFLHKMPGFSCSRFDYCQLWQSLRAAKKKVATKVYLVATV